MVFASNTINLRISVIVGGMDMLQQQSEIADIPHIIVTTPGRFVHQLMHDQANLHDYLENLQFIVFDEADRLLTDQSFQSDLQYIFSKIQPQENTRNYAKDGKTIISQRQTFLFSATMASNYDRYLSKEVLFGKPTISEQIVHCGAQASDGEGDSAFVSTVQGLTQRFALIPQNVKEMYFVHILRTKKLKKS